MTPKGYSFTLIGSREINQDSFLVNNDKRLFAVADGVGGGIGGEVASAMAVDRVEKLVNEPGQLKECFETAQRDILEHAIRELGSPLMGTTLTAAYVGENIVHLCHIGDSRLYVYSDDHLKLQTDDMEFYDDRVGATVLGSYLGMPADLQPLTIYQEAIPVTPGSRILLCSDGLHHQMSEPRMVEIIKRHYSDPQDVARTLAEEASLTQQSDNITIVYVELD